MRWQRGFDEKSLHRRKKCNVVGVKAKDYSDGSNS